MSQRKPHRKPPIRSLVSYSYEAPAGSDSIDETPIERILERALGQNIVSQYDTGRGRVVWFNGAAGPSLRRIRDQVRALLPANWTRQTHG
jgi:hypothetical protein